MSQFRAQEAMVNGDSPAPSVGPLTPSLAPSGD
jgi:hypothetical protein